MRNWPTRLVFATLAIVLLTGFTCQPPADCRTTGDKPSLGRPQTWDNWGEFQMCMTAAMDEGCVEGEVHEMPDGTTHFHCGQWLNTEGDA